MRECEYAERVGNALRCRRLKEKGIRANFCIHQQYCTRSCAFEQSAAWQTCSYRERGHET